MDGGSGLNILYVDTLDAMRIPWSELRPVSSPFHSVILGMQAHPVRQINLPITFGDLANFYLKVLTFKVVDFPRSYHAILGRPCYAKFMVIPNYTYLKLKCQDRTASSPWVAPFCTPTRATASIMSSPLPSSTPLSSQSSGIHRLQ